MATFLADKAVVQRVGFTTHTSFVVFLILRLYQRQNNEYCLNCKIEMITIIYADILIFANVA